MKLQPADIQWRDGQPFNVRYNDIYYSDQAGDGGIDEVNRVFLQPAAIPEKLQALPDDDCLIVAELGFGSGLNFACAASLAHQAGKRLHFISFERHPFTPAQWRRVVYSPRLQGTACRAIYQQLQQQPLPMIDGWHRRHFCAGRIVLSVFHGDASDGLHELRQRSTSTRKVDAWLLDGFTPQKNPSLWTPAIFQQLAQLSKMGTTVATFSVAGSVRRGLREAGFKLQKYPQPPYKRESLCGVWPHPAATKATVPPRVVHVHGAGLAGATMARQLAEDNFQVTVFDPQPPAAAGSKIRTAILHSRLLGNGSVEARLRLQAFQYSSSFYRRFAGVHTTGVLQVNGPNMDATKMLRISDAYGGERTEHNWIHLLTANQAQDLANTPLCSPRSSPLSRKALWFPAAAIVDIPRLCQQLLDHPNIQLQQTRIPVDHNTPTILCTGTAARQHPGLHWLEIADVYGQLDTFQRSPGGPRVPIVGNGYYVPLTSHQHPGAEKQPARARTRTCAIGASYEHHPWQPVQATAHNMQLNKHYFSPAEVPPTWQSRSRAARCVSSDRIPLVGQVAQNLWLATAFGSMGTSMAPLAAALVSSHLGGWTPPLDSEVEDLLHPQRLHLRQARRGIRQV